MKTERTGRKKAPRRGKSVTGPAGESGLFFGQEQPSPARADFEELRSLLAAHRPPVGCRLVLGHCAGWHAPYQTGLIYPAGSDDLVLGYLGRHQYRGGINVASGPGAVAEFFQAVNLLDSLTVEAATAGGRARSRPQAKRTGTARKRRPSGQSKEER